MFDTLPSSSNSSLQVVRDQQLTQCAASVQCLAEDPEWGCAAGVDAAVNRIDFATRSLRHTRGVLYLSKRDATRLVRFGAPRVFIYSLYIHCVVCVTRCRLCVEGFWLCCLSQCSLSIVRSEG